MPIFKALRMTSRPLWMPWCLSFPRFLVLCLLAASRKNEGISAWSTTSACSKTKDYQLMNRRSAIVASSICPTALLLGGFPPSAIADSSLDSESSLRVIRDPNTYQALVYQPAKRSTVATSLPPLLVVLHGAGRNDLDIRQDLADPKGEHAGLIPSLIESGSAPSVLLENFVVVAPYSEGQPSFYQDSRTKMLDFVEWLKMDSSIDNASVSFDPERIFLMGFSDGATVAVELMTTRRFAGAVVCSYGFTGTLPQRAIEKIAGLPFWVFHSADDVIFDVSNSDRLVTQLRSGTKQATDPLQDDRIRYNRYNHDPEHLSARVRGHSMGITASKSPELYEWMRRQTKSS